MKDLTGQRFGRLTALERVYDDKRKGKYGKWKCICDCGNIIIVLGYSMKNSNVRSCGCWRSEGNERDELVKRFGFVEKTSLSNLKKGLQKNNTSGVKGVSYKKKSGKFVASIQVQGRYIYLGSYDSLEEAAEERKKAEKQYFKPILEQHKKATDRRQAKSVTQ